MLHCAFKLVSLLGSALRTVLHLLIAYSIPDSLDSTVPLWMVCFRVCYQPSIQTDSSTFIYLHTLVLNVAWSDHSMFDPNHPSD